MNQHRSKIPLFPTILYQFKIEDNLINELDTLIEEDYRFWDNANQYISISDDTQHLRNNETIEKINENILSEVNNILDDLKLIRDTHFLSGMWHNVSSEPYRHHQHIHPNAFLSGIIYVRTPDKCGPTVFSDPRIQKYVFHPDYSEFNIENSPTFTQYPEKGLVVVFPGWLQHYVDNGSMNSRDKRITTSFNINLHGNSSLKTAQLSY